MFHRIRQHGSAVTMDIRTPRIGTSHPVVEEVIREDVNGTRLVRTKPDELAEAFDTGRTVIHDYEPAHGAVTYTYTDSVGNQAATSIDVNLPSPILHSVTLPNTVAEISILSDISRSRSLSISPASTPYGNWSTFHGGVPHDAQISLRIETKTYVEAREFEALFHTNSPLMLRQADHAGLDAYLRAVSISVNSQVPAGTNTLWAVDVEAIEIPWPSIELVATQTARFNRYRDAENEFATYADAKIEGLTYNQMLTRFVWWL